MLDGVARKIGFAIAGLNVLWWILFVIGFELIFREGSVSYAATLPNYPYWLVSVGGLPLTLLAFAHAIVSHAKAAKILGMITTFFCIFFLLGLGMLDYLEGFNIYMYYRDGYWPRPYTLQFHAMNIRFAGSFLATVGWTVLMVGIWPFYVVVPGNPQYQNVQ